MIRNVDFISLIVQGRNVVATVGAPQDTIAPSGYPPLRRRVVLVRAGVVPTQRIKNVSDGCTAKRGMLQTYLYVGGKRIGASLNERRRKL